MASLRDIKRKIRVVSNISQITQAMKMVAAAKLRRVQERVESGRPYSQTMAELVGMLAPTVTEFQHPLRERNRHRLKRARRNSDSSSWRWRRINKAASGSELRMQVSGCISRMLPRSAGGRSSR